MKEADADLRRAFAWVRPHARRLVLVLVLSLASTAVTLFVPYLSKLLIDDAFLARDAGALVRLVGMFVIVSIAGFLLTVASGLRYTRVSADILFDMRSALYAHLQRLSPRFYARTPLGDIVSRLNNDIGEIQRIASETLLAWLGHVLFLAGAVAIMVWLDWRLFLASVALVPASVVALVLYRRRLEARVLEVRERSAVIGQFLIESLQGMRTVVASNAQFRESARFRGRNDAFIAALMRMQKLHYLGGGVPALLLAASTAVVFLYGGTLVIRGEVTLGTFIAFLAYQMRLPGPIQGLMGLYANLATIRVSLRRVNEIFDTAPEVTDPPAAAGLQHATGAVVLDEVRYGFGRGAPVLDDVRLAVEPGAVVAIVGPSGAGKSTVADLLVRYCDPDAGVVRLDGHDLRTLRLEDVRRHVAVVDQEPFLFHATLRDNVRYARPEASDAEVLAALETAALGPLLARLPEGLETVVGERGRALSTGERQRVALARALLLMPAVLVLDEPTAALDAEAEAHVLRGFDAAMAGRTTIIITHRPEVARRADRVLELRDGRLRELRTIPAPAAAIPVALAGGASGAATP
jgi:ATP-binding cassette, subfamily B, bacterial